MKKLASLILAVLLLAVFAGSALADDTWTCPNGHTGQTGKFCAECGAARPAAQADDTWTCPNGHTGQIGKFCGECGAARPVAEAQRACTKAFLDELDARQLVYTYRGIDDDDDEGVFIDFDGDNTTISVYCYFTSDEELCYMRVWNFIDYDAASFSSVLVTVNDLNSSYRYAKFFADTYDNSVTVATDLILRSADDVGAICVEGLWHLVQIADLGYPDLVKYALK